ncbi:hypothetical protein KC359_g157 [Hortaea werneckii]|nr:hypothetical protein KC359_g157 [Hortaea werneckii]
MLRILRSVSHDRVCFILRLKLFPILITFPFRIHWKGWPELSSIAFDGFSSNLSTVSVASIDMYSESAAPPRPFHVQPVYVPRAPASPNSVRSTMESISLNRSLTLLCIIPE